MFDTAVVALDLSPAEQPLLDCIPDLRGWGLRRVIVTHILQVGYAQGAGVGHEQDYVDEISRRLGPLREAGLEVDVVVRAGTVVADEILSVAAERAADLIMIGSRSRNRIRGLFLGSVARELIRKTRLPVLLEWIEPTDEATAARCEAVCRQTLRHLLLCTDFSRQAQAAERVACALAARAGRVDCVHVMDDAAYLATPRLPVMAKAALADLRAGIAAAGGRGEDVLLQGESAPAIAALSRERGISMIVVGKHGQGWIESMLIGSTAAMLCETAGRPVLVVP